MNLDDNAFFWAEEEQEKTGLKLEETKMVNLGDFYIRDDQHTALFHKTGTDCALLRIRRYTDGLLVYRLIVDYNHMFEKSPEIIGMLIRTGHYVYQKATKGANSKIVELNFLR